MFFLPKFAMAQFQSNALKESETTVSPLVSNLISLDSVIAKYLGAVGGLRYKC